MCILNNTNSFQKLKGTCPVMNIYHQNPAIHLQLQEIQINNPYFQWSDLTFYTASVKTAMGRFSLQLRALRFIKSHMPAGFPATKFNRHMAIRGP